MVHEPSVSGSLKFYCMIFHGNGYTFTRECTLCMDNVFVGFEARLCGRTVGIPMGIGCAPFVART